MSGAQGGDSGDAAGGRGARTELETDFMLPDGRRPVAGAVLLNRRGEVLLQHRDDKPGIESPGLWSLFGGGLDVNESPAAAMLREIEEEIGYRPRAFRPLVVFSGWSAEFHIYLAEVGPPIGELVLGEGQGFAFFGREEAERLELTEVARVAFEALRQLELQRDQHGGGELLPGHGV